ncbi:hypothetical protein [Magnetospirillum sp. SS-4]|uniref:hypothetical protein n=1 Tax=Magnetospirillum sp. SS-4 TaxID=2681465 RepID=UPI0013835B7E|nr:hypothetical protein [Magnetospirillum sp. SS-4]CAA7627625.1 exported hypothetical protein [Magnetospirillum sp. SS-4]
MRYKVAIAAAALILTAESTLAADPHRLAYSEKMGVEVFAQPDATGAWCRPALALSLMLKDNSPLIQGGVTEFLPKLAPVLAQECPAATTFAAAAYKASDRSQVGTTYTSSKAAGWATTTVTTPQQTQTAPNVQVAPQQPPPQIVAVAPPSPTPAPTATPSATQAPVPPVPIPVAPPSPVAAVAPPPVPVRSLRELADPIDYWPLIFRYVKEYPVAADNTETLKSYASASDCRNFAPVAKNEFRLTDYLAKAKTSLMSEVAKPYIRITLNARFGQYDPKAGSFEFAPLAESSYWDAPNTFCSGSSRAAITRFSTSWGGGKTVFGLPANASEAEALVDYIDRKRYGRRDVYLELIVKPTFTPATPDGIAHVTFELIEATAYRDRDSAKVLYSYTADDLVNAAKAREQAIAVAVEAKRRAEEEKGRQRALMQQRYQAEADLRTLPNASHAARVAYFHDGSRALSTVSATIGRSLVQGGPQPAIFMVKAGGNGTSSVKTAWPGRLKLDLAGGLPELVKGQWYVVSGDLQADNANRADSKPYVGRLAVKSVSGCQRNGCADADDVPSLVRRRYPELSAQTGSTQ